jgi:mRNA degradation ribonuclease J1/J2
VQLSLLLRQPAVWQDRQLVEGLLQPLLLGGDTLTPESQESFRRRSMAAAGFGSVMCSLNKTAASDGVGNPTSSSTGLVERTESVESSIIFLTDSIEIWLD